MMRRAVCAPARCPAERGRPRETAQRPLPSEIDGDVQGTSGAKLMGNLSGLLQDNGRRLHVLLSKGTGRYCYKLLCIAKYRSKKNSPLLTLARSPNQRFHVI